MTLNVSSEDLIKLISSIIGDFSKEDPISLHEPFFKDTNALDLVKNCIEDGWVSSAGTYVKEFENELKKYTKAKFAIPVINGTVGLRLALYLIGVKPNDEVIIPPISFVATANSVSHLNAIPHFVDVDKITLSLCPKALRKRLKQISFTSKGNTYNKVTGRRISAIIPVHIFGNPALMDELLEISKSWNIPIVEDAAEALGSWYINSKKNTHCGLLGNLGVLSFNGNKIITTGGGGAVITDNEDLAFRAKHISNTAKLTHNWEYEHNEVGWNDRMPNINAALGVAQMKVLANRIYLKKKLADKYINLFKQINNFEILSPNKNTISNNWLVSIRLRTREKLAAKSEIFKLLSDAHAKGLLLRPLWKPLHQLPMYLNNPKGELKNTEEEFFRIVNLPSSPQILSNHKES